MGDSRFHGPYNEIAGATDRHAVMRNLPDESIIEALAAASRENDPFLANVLATEAENRMLRLRATLAHLPEGIASLGIDGHIQWLNPRAEELLSVDRRAVIGSDIHQVIEHRNDDLALIPHESCSILHAMRSGTVTRKTDEHFVLATGSFMCVSYTCAPLRSRDGDVNGCVLIFTDCRAERDRDILVKEQKVRFESLFENLPIGVVTLDPQGTIVAANPAASEISQFDPVEARGHSFVVFTHPDDVEELTRLLREVLQGRNVTAPVRIRRKDGEFVTLRASGVPIVDDGRVVGVHCLVERDASGAPRRIRLQDPA